MECFRGVHWLYVVTGSSLFLVYVGLSARLLRVGGELQNSEAVWYNPFDWRGDSKKRMPYTHALSLAKNEHEVGTVAVKEITAFVGPEPPLKQVQDGNKVPWACSKRLAECFTAEW